jgi:hypothetical protein
MSLDRRTRRLMALVRQKAMHFIQAVAIQERDQLLDRFEQLNGETLAQIKALRDEITRLHAVNDFASAERDESVKWLH